MHSKGKPREGQYRRLAKIFFLSRKTRDAAMSGIGRIWEYLSSCSVSFASVHKELQKSISERMAKSISATLRSGKRFNTICIWCDGLAVRRYLLILQAWKGLVSSRGVFRLRRLLAL